MNFISETLVWFGLMCILKKYHEFTGLYIFNVISCFANSYRLHVYDTVRIEHFDK